MGKDFRAEKTVTKALWWECAVKSQEVTAAEAQ